MAHDEEVLAVRTGVAWSDEPATALIRVTGDGAFELLDRACPGEIFVRDGQLRPALLLDSDARVIADLYLGQEDDAYLLFAEGMTGGALATHLTALQPEGAEATIEDLSPEHELIALHGPYAWELLGELMSPDLIGMPYLSLYRTDDVLCVRGGKTGEYGYDLFVPRERAAALRRRLDDVGKAFDLRRIGLDAIDQCMLENNFFNVRREGKKGLDPIELGLQWRVSYRKPYAGAEALRARREAGPKRRITWIASGTPLEEGAEITLDGAPIGEVLVSGLSPVTRSWIGIALLDKPYYHAGIDCFMAGPSGERRPVVTVTPPVIHNRSLYVNPQRHAFQTRDRDKLPPLV